ncbi:uncharacterized protein C56G2.4-like [Haliotis asinina]|uniref:uncharacterized protein C56G2.4-like n=1 Tax=Haliotis asinina TaxID=109174 RepID=UPI003531EB06
MATSGSRFVSIVSFLAALSHVHSHKTLCTNQFTNETCLNAAYDTLNNNTYFWFGTDYSKMCPNGDDGTQMCANHRPNNADSIMSRMFAGTSVSTSSRPSIMEIYYARPLERIYNGCGAEIKMTSRSESFKIGPLNPHQRGPVELKDMPTVSWNATANVKYTVVYYDVGYNIVHGIYINANGGNITLGEVVVPHRGPLNTLWRPNIYVWMVFEQRKNMELNEVKAYINSTNMFRNPMFMKDFMERYNLSDPVSFNIVRCWGDDYAAVAMRNRRVFNRCPFFNQRRIKSMVDSHGGVTFNLSAEASISLDLHYMTPDMSFTFCCSAKKTGAANLHVDYRSKGNIMAAKARTKPMIHLVPRNLSSNLEGHFFTLMLIDPTKELNTTTPNSIVHWLVVNIHAENISSGDVLVEYMPPMPHATRTMFLALLYKQANRSEQVKNITGLFGSDCPRNTKCRFQVQNFVTMNNLVLTGLRQMDVEQDDYNRLQEVKKGMKTAQDACRGRTGYADPCPVGTGHPLKSSIVAISALTLLAVVCQKAF